MANNDPIAAALNIAPMVVDEPIEGELIPAPVPGNSPQSDEDFETARSNMQETISQGQKALENMLQLAIRSQNARSYEVLANLINTMMNANRELYDIHAAKKELSGVEDGPSGGNGEGLTTSELLAALRDNLKTLKDDSKD